MNRSHSQLDTHHSRHLSLHKPGAIPHSSRNISPISSNRHRYELKQKIWPKETVESWFAHHSSNDRRAVYSFLDTLYADDKGERLPVQRHRRSSIPRLPNRTNTTIVHSPSTPIPRRMSNNGGHESRASKRDLGEILDSLESYRSSPSSHERGIRTSATPLAVPLPEVKNGRKSPKHSKRSTSSVDKYTEMVPPPDPIDTSSNVDGDESNKLNRRYLSQTWRVINPREDAAPNVRPENNASSFFNFTKKVYPEYFFIHPDWY